ncbi:hypothetical protein MRX96_042941 [Rhipicephalus microplus]
MRNRWNPVSSPVETSRTSTAGSLSGETGNKCPPARNDRSSRGIVARRRLIGRNVGTCEGTHGHGRVASHGEHGAGLRPRIVHYAFRSRLYDAAATVDPSFATAGQRGPCRSHRNDNRCSLSQAPPMKFRIR